MKKSNKKGSKSAGGAAFTDEQLNAITQMIAEAREVERERVTKELTKKAKKADEAKELENLDVTEGKMLQKKEKTEVLINFFKNSDDKKLKKVAKLDAEEYLRNNENYFYFDERVFSVSKAYKSEDYQAKEIKSLIALNEKAGSQANKAKKTGEITILRYTDKTSAIIGNSKDYKIDIKKLGGIWSRSLCINLQKFEGWLLSNKKLADVEKLIKK